MNEDDRLATNKLLDGYCESVRRNFTSLDSSDSPSELELYRSSLDKRFSTFLAYQYTLAGCSNQAACSILSRKLKEYTSFIDDRKRVNNFASLAKSLAQNTTNLSKKWQSGLTDCLPDLSIGDVLKSDETDSCENVSIDGCCAIDPSDDQLQRFSDALRKITSQARCDNVQTSQPISNQIGCSDRRKTSLYSTYEDSYLDQRKCAMERIVSLGATGQSVPEQSCRTVSAQGKLPFKGTTKIARDSLPQMNSRRRDCSSNSSGALTSGRSNERFKKLNSYLQEDEAEERTPDLFRTASETLKLQNQMKHGGRNQRSDYQSGAVKKSLGGKGRAASSRFIPPLRSQENENEMLITRSVLGRQYSGATAAAGPGDSTSAADDNFTLEDERLRLIDPKMVEMIRSEIMDHGSTVTWEDIAGLEFAKHTIQEIVVWPMLRPDIFTGLRRPPKGILLFGPPGTGKTLIGKCIASQSKSTFFSISASSLTSKWIGDGEKMVRALFAVARVEQPSVVFIDEIDSLLSQRSDQEHESSRRIKTEFLVQLDGAATGEEDRLLIIGATNRPQELDEAARRRLVKRLYIPLPDHKARKQLVSNLMSKERNDLTDEDLEEVSKLTEGYSGADMKNLCQEASLGPIRAISASLIASINPHQVRPVNIEDFKAALKRVRSSVSSKEIDLYIEWDKQFGMSC